MSVDLIVYLRRSSMPSPTAWKQAITSVGFPADLDDDFDIDTFSGFLPCPFDGKPSGFEYFSAPLSSTNAKATGVPPDSDFSITFVTHADMRELAASISAASVLCAISDGVLVDPQSGESFSDDTVLSWARKSIDGMKKHFR